jgi:glycosyltransferase involved in cell wall biosynthesis
MNKQNKFKIITPSYNNENWVEYNLASVLNQTYENWEVLYINDNSTDLTFTKVGELVENDPRFTLINNKINMGAAHNYMEHMSLIENNDEIVVHLDGDDWFADEYVLEKLNLLYNKTDCWMTYGKFVQWDGENYIEANPQNTPYHDFVHDHKYYRRDIWRSSHLRTYRTFLFNSIKKEDLINPITKEYYWHAIDLAWQFPCMEMCGKEKIEIPNFYTYVYNQHPSVVSRTREREHINNMHIEEEIRNKKIYKTGLGNGTLPQINVIGDFRERNSIPSKFSYVYNRLHGDFDATLIQDGDCFKYIAGEFGKLPGIVIADLHEPRHLFNYNSLHSLIKQNSDKFHYILTYDEDLLELPNAIFRNGGYECVLNKNVHSLEHPLLADESLFGVYTKSKNISYISSNKTFTEFHIFRNQCASFIRDNRLPVDIYGVGYNFIKQKLDGLKDYKFSIAIENGELNNYFTEKILDCFLTGTVPIYRGCSNIHKFFNMDGIITFDTIVELQEIINSVVKNEYTISNSTLTDNYDRALEYCYNNDRFFNKYLKEIINA